MFHSKLDEGKSFNGSIRESLTILNKKMVNDTRKMTPFEIVNGYKFEDGFDRKMKADLRNREKKRQAEII